MSEFWVRTPSIGWAIDRWTALIGRLRGAGSPRVPEFRKTARALFQREAKGSIVGTKEGGGLLRRISGPGRLLIFGIGLAAVLAVGVLDWVTGREVSFSIFYLLPVCFTAWFAGKRLGFALSMFAAVVWMSDDLAENVYSHSLIPYWNALARLSVFVLTSFLVDRVRLLTAGLETSVKERTAELEAEVVSRKQLEREAVDISHREQERVAHELHDHLGACLAGVAFRAKALGETLARRGDPEAAAAQEIVRVINRTADEVRSFARLLAPPVHSATGGLDVALSRLGAEMERLFEITCVVDVLSPLPALTDEQARHLYRITQEATRNAVQHAAAKRVQISIGCAHNQLTLTVGNDGNSWVASDHASEGLGLRTMRYRTEVLGGKLSIKAVDGSGTLLICEVPVVSASHLK